MDNPYQSPERAGESQPLPREVPQAGRRGEGSGRVVDRIRLVAILMIVQGVLDLVFGVGLALMGLLGCWAISTDIEQRGAPGMQNPEFFIWYMVGFYSLFALLHVIPGILHIYAGMRNYRCRGRTLGIISLGIGVVTIFILFCAPTAIALAVFGMIVYFSEDAAEAFRLGDQGCNVTEIRARLG